MFSSLCFHYAVHRVQMVADAELPRVGISVPSTVRLEDSNPSGGDHVPATGLEYTTTPDMVPQLASVGAYQQHAFYIHPPDLQPASATAFVAAWTRLPSSSRKGAPVVFTISPPINIKTASPVVSHINILHQANHHNP